MQWGTKREIDFVRGLAKKDIAAVKNYQATIDLREWGSIKKEEIIKECKKLLKTGGAASPKQARKQ